MIARPVGAQVAPQREEMRGPIVRCPVPVKNRRRVLCVFPSYVPAFGTFQHAYRLMYGVKAFMPPQGLLLIAAYMPESWPVRFVDENIKPATEADFAWADIVLVTGMHIQVEQILSHGAFTADHFAPMDTSKAAQQAFWAPADRILDELDNQ